MAFVVRSRNIQLLMMGGWKRKNKRLCLNQLTAGLWVIVGPRTTADWSCHERLFREKQTRLGGVLIFPIIREENVIVAELIVLH